MELSQVNLTIEDWEKASIGYTLTPAHEIYQCPKPAKKVSVFSVVMSTTKCPNG